MPSRWASPLALAALSCLGCGLVLDNDPPDPQPSLDGGALDAAVELRDADVPECTDDAHCDDGVYCNGDERCEAGVCALGAPPCESVEPACATAECREDDRSCAIRPLCAPGEVCGAGGMCVPAPDCRTPSDCPPDSDDDRCTGWTNCVAGRCVAVAPVVCPSMGCLVSRCDPEAGECDVLVPSDAACADDGAACTREVCAPGADRADPSGCLHVPDDSLCDATTILPAGSCARAVCTASTVASSILPDLASGCGVALDGSLCAAGQLCHLDDLTLPMCMWATRTCEVPSDCDDRNPCNGVERCVGGYCDAALVPRCPDAGCREGYCERSAGGPRCALRDTAECFAP